MDEADLIVEIYQKIKECDICYIDVVCGVCYTSFLIKHGKKSYNLYNLNERMWNIKIKEYKHHPNELSILRLEDNWKNEMRALNKKYEKEFSK